MKNFITSTGVFIFILLIISGLSLLIGWVITDKTNPNLEECMEAGWFINTIVLSIIITVIFFNI